MIARLIASKKGRGSYLLFRWDETGLGCNPRGYYQIPLSLPVIL